MKKLAIIGASYLQLPLVCKAKEMGVETHCFAWEEGAVCKEIVDFFYPISIVNKEQILEVCKEVKIDGITSIASDAAVPTICYVADRLGLTGNKIEDALACTNKFQMRMQFQNHGVASPKFVFTFDGSMISGIDSLRLPVIVKPTDRSGSRGVMKITEKEQLNDAVLRAQYESFAKQAIIEEYIAGSEVSVESISWEGNHYILAVTDKVTTGDPYFVELEHHQPSLLPDSILDQVKHETLKALSALNIRYGASHTELKITEDGEVYVIEVGARMGGDFIGSDLVKLSTGYDFVRAVIQVALGEFEKPVIEFSKSSGVYFLCKETECLKKIIDHPEEYTGIVEAEITNDELFTIQCSADRSGYFIYQSQNKFIL